MSGGHETAASSGCADPHAGTLGALEHRRPKPSNASKEGALHNDESRTDECQKSEHLELRELPDEQFRDAGQEISVSTSGDSESWDNGAREYVSRDWCF